MDRSVYLCLIIKNRGKPNGIVVELHSLFDIFVIYFNGVVLKIIWGNKIKIKWERKKFVPKKYSIESLVFIASLLTNIFTINVVF